MKRWISAAAALAMTGTLAVATDSGSVAAASISPTDLVLQVESDPGAVSQFLTYVSYPSFEDLVADTNRIGVDVAEPRISGTASSTGLLAGTGDGGPVDSDGDGVPDADDQCPGQDDTIDVDSDGVPDCIDPLIDSDGDGVADADDICPGTVLPDEPTKRLGFFRFAAQADGTFDAGWSKLDGRYTIADTGGCSGMQIGIELGAKKITKKYGLGWGALKFWIHTRT